MFWALIQSPPGASMSQQQGSIKPDKSPECAHSSLGPGCASWFQLWQLEEDLETGWLSSNPPACQWFLDSRFGSGRSVLPSLPQGCPSRAHCFFCPRD